MGSHMVAVIGLAKLTIDFKGDRKGLLVCLLPDLTMITMIAPTNVWTNRMGCPTLSGVRWPSYHSAHGGQQQAIAAAATHNWECATVT